MLYCFSLSLSLSLSHIYSPADIVQIKKMQDNQGKARWSPIESYPVNNKRLPNNIAKAYGVNSSKTDVNAKNEL